MLRKNAIGAHRCCLTSFYIKAKFSGKHVDIFLQICQKFIFAILNIWERNSKKKQFIYFYSKTNDFWGQFGKYWMFITHFFLARQNITPKVCNRPIAENVLNSRIAKEVVTEYILRFYEIWFFWEKNIPNLNNSSVTFVSYSGIGWGDDELYQVDGLVIWLWS